MGAALGALVLTSVLGGSTPALAFDDKPSTFDPLINIIGLGKDEDEKPAIDFRERPALVVPKSTELPALRPAAPSAPPTGRSTTMSPVSAPPRPRRAHRASSA